jgi:Uncharacterized conserved protein (DUF2183)
MNRNKNSRLAYIAKIIVLSGFFFGMPISLFGTEIQSDENVQFYPSIAKVLANGDVEAHIDAWVYELEDRPGLSTLLARYLGLDLDKLSEHDRKLFMQRTQLFRVDSHSGKTVQIQFSNQITPLEKTSITGKIRARLTVAGVAKTVKQVQWLSYSARLPKDDARKIEGRVLLLPNEGISVVSDIDDTIKNSNVLDRKQLLLNTFARPFVVVPGMAERYRNIAKQPGSAFHYVSGSPHHLYPVIADFLRVGNFPEGTMHLRDLNWRKELFGREGGSKEHKFETIRQLMQDFPQRKFIFFGDSGEHDPEIYGQLAREFPAQVLEIHIRNVTDQTRSNSRYAVAFKGVPKQRWFVNAQ